MEDHQKFILQWSYCWNDHYAVASVNDLKIFQKGANNDSPDKYKLKASIPQVPYSIITCLEWSKNDEQPFMICCGMANGKVALIKLEEIEEENLGLGQFPHTLLSVKSESSNIRCSTISWNPVLTERIACGYENNEKVHIWDINKISEADIQKKPFIKIGNMKSTNKFSKPAFQINHGGPVSSLAWFPDNPNILICGGDSMKIFDIRQEKELYKNTVFNSSILGIEFEKYNNSTIMTYTQSDGIKIFDKASLKSPFITLKQESTLFAQWCTKPSMPNLIASFSKSLNNEQSYINFWNVLGIGEVEPKPPQDNKMTIVKPFKQKNSSLLFPNSQCHCFSWVPGTSTILAISKEGELKSFEYKFCDFLPMDLSVRSELAFYTGKDLISYNCHEDINYEEINISESNDSEEKEENLEEEEQHNIDISHLILHRLELGYGLDIDLNIKISDKFNNKGISSVWSWMSNCLALSDLPNFQNEQRSIFSGIKSLFANPKDINNEKYKIKFPYYDCQQRRTAIYSCGWTNIKGEANSEKLDELCKLIDEKQQTIRAGTIASFHFNFELAKRFFCRSETANMGEDPTNIKIALSIVVMLEDIQKDERRVNESKIESIKEISKKVYSSMRHPYLKLFFAYLSQDNDIIKKQARDVDIEFVDKIAFMCRFMKKEDLVKELSYREEKMAGKIENLILFGLTKDNLHIIQNFLDISNDVQTAALLECFYEAYTSGSKENLKQARQWRQGYQSFLNKQKLWNQRAKFDISFKELLRSSKKQKKIIEEEVKVKERSKNELTPFCYFCGSNLNFEDIKKKSHPPTFQNRHTKKILDYCPDCKKPLPRCSICFLPMGLLNPSLELIKKMGNKASEINQEEKNIIGSSNMDWWFAWCQKCKHGGHAIHLTEWFKNHNECPVAECNCKCKLQ